MSDQPKAKNVDLREEIRPELDLVRSSSNTVGALYNLKPLLERIQSLPGASQVILQVKNQIHQEDQCAFERRQKSVEWVHEKLELLIKSARRLLNHNDIAETESLLNFRTVTLNSSGYFGALFFHLTYLSSVIVKEEKYLPLFEGWAEIIKPKKLQKVEPWEPELPEPEPYISHFKLPDYVEQEIGLPVLVAAKSLSPLEEEVYRWKVRTDTSLPDLFRFLEFLSQHDSIRPVTTSPSANPSGMLDELVSRQHQACVDNYLGAFKSSEPKDHPLTKAELITLIERFVSTIEKKIRVQVGTLEQSTLSANQRYWRTQQSEADIQAMIPFAKEYWTRTISKDSNPMRIGRKAMTENFLRILPKNVSLYATDKKRLPRAEKALKRTDPRIFENGRYLGLKPYWDKFGWVDP